jgi:hypothetical protein
MLNAKSQAENYARLLPSSHEWPPFIVVCDVGHCFELYADFTGKGRNYTQFPDRQGFRVPLDELRKPETRELFARMWRDPQALDPTRKAARATREIAERLAAVSKRLEDKGHAPEEVALFLMRCLFTMFAEDVELLPKDSFKALLDKCVVSPSSFAPLMEDLWRNMNAGGFAASIAEPVKKFNGHLFASARAFPMEREEIGELREAAAKDWAEVDPSIFGTLLEQALNPDERARLGAHYTPRAYVERLVIATVIEPLRDEWKAVLATVERLKSEGEDKQALAEVSSFHARLCALRILDPACGTGNFLYVTLELMKRLEGEVLDTILNLGGQEALRLESHNIDPHQFLGLEINPRAAAIAELVLWIGYLRWHLRTKGEPPTEPILRGFRNIEKRDAVLEHDGYARDGDKVVYQNPRRPDWPEADYIVGNPPFIGKGALMRAALGDAYVEALWKAHPDMNESADFVMYWWNRAAELLTRKDTRLKRFGLVTTNSITQVFNRRVIERHLRADTPVSIVLAIADHPWTKATPDSASVRIAMTVSEAGKRTGVLQEVTSESGLDSDEPQIEFNTFVGIINSDLSVGFDLTRTVILKASEGLSYNGMMLAARGFTLSPREAEHFVKEGRREKVIRPFVNGGDLVRVWRRKFVIDCFGLSSEEVREQYPIAYQHLLGTVKVERDAKRDRAFRERWWLFGRNRPELRAGIEKISRYIGTTETAKHRVFQFLDASVLPDHMVIAISSSDAFHLGVLSSRIHVTWALMQGGTLEDRPRYTKSHCFDPFPFPEADPLIRAQIADIAEKIDRHRKDVQMAHPDITLTQMYNVLEKLRGAAEAPPHPIAQERDRPGPAPPLGSGRSPLKSLHRSDLPASPSQLTPRGERGSGDGPAQGAGPPSPARGEGSSLSAAEEDIKARGLVLILKEYHDELDRLVFKAYGWPETLTDEEILGRLVALNKERAQEEARGIVKWLRPDYQIPRFGKAQDRLKLEGGEAHAVEAVAAKAKPAFPKEAVAQTAAVMAALADASAPVSAGDLAQGFKQGGKAKARIEATLASLARTGFIAVYDGGRKFSLRRVA